MPKFLFSLFPLLVFSSHAFSQSEAEQTLFTNNYANLNPAMSGLIYKREANVLWRNQWTAVNGAPTTLWANYNQQLSQVHGSVGLNYYYDVIGHNKCIRLLSITLITFGSKKPPCRLVYLRE